MSDAAEQPAKVWVLVIDEDERWQHASWVSVHLTEHGANTRLAKKVDEWGLHDALADDTLPYSISYLDVEP